MFLHSFLPFVSPDRHGYTPLLLLLHHLNSCWNAEDEGAESNKDVKKCVELMLNYGADPNIQCSTGHSALHVILHRNLFRYSSLVALAGYVCVRLCVPACVHAKAAFGSRSGCKQNQSRCKQNQSRCKQNILL